MSDEVVAITVTEEEQEYLEWWVFAEEDSAPDSPMQSVARKVWAALPATAEPAQP